MTLKPLPHPRRYIPVSKNPFAFTAGLSTIALDEKIIQIDSTYPDYIQTKQHNRHQSHERYIQKLHLGNELEAHVTEFLINQIIRDWPEYFTINQQYDSVQLSNHLTGEILLFDINFNLIKSSGNSYTDSLDALLSQIQEDFSIVELGKVSDAIRYLHLCFPNFWSAEDKIGKDFIDAHRAVPGMEKINKSHESLSHTLSTSGPFERFTWGLSTSSKLDQHPLDKPDDRRSFLKNEDFFLRVERQVTVPLNPYNAYLFFIRTYFEDTRNLNEEEIGRLIHSLTTMPEEIARYKGIATDRESIIEKLNKLQSD